MPTLPMLPSSMRTFGFITSFALAATGAMAQQASSTNTLNPTKPISLQEVITSAVQNNLDLQIVRYEPRLFGYDLSAALAAYDPDLALSVTRSHSERAPGFDIEGRPIAFSRETDATAYDAGIGPNLVGLLPTGTTYSFGYGLERTSVANEDGTGSKQYTGDFQFRIEQPLLRNLWIDQPRTTLKIARRNIKLGDEMLREQLMRTILSVEQAYYTLIFTRENVKVQATALELASQLLRENRKRVEVGALAPLDEKQAEAEVAATRSALINAERAYSQQQNVLKNLITDEYIQWAGLNLEPVENLVALPAEQNLQESWKRGLAQRPDLAQLKIELEKAGINLKFRKNQLFPDLRLVGTYGHNENQPSLADVAAELPSSENRGYSVAAILRIPLGNRAARASYNSAKANEQQAVLRFKQLEQLALVEIDDAVKQIQSSFERVEATRAARAFSQEALAAEQKKLESGKSTSFLVLQAQRDLTVRRYDEIQALAEYNNALANMAFREGTTLERHNIELK